LEMSNGSIESAVDLYYSTGAPQIDEVNQPYETHNTSKESKNLSIDLPTNNDHGADEKFDIDEVMKKAIDEHGAKSIGEAGDQEKEHYVGTAHQLGEKGKVSKTIVVESKQDKRRIIVFYKDCFTLDDGPPRKFDDPANKVFLDSIKAGMYPPEIQPRYGEEIEVELIDKKGEDWKPTPKDIKRFDGTAQSMGASKSVSASTARAKTIVVDTGKPQGSIKVRFFDGSNQVVKVNHEHTILDLKCHLESIKPCNKAFVLSIQSSGQALNDISQTCKDAGVIGVAVVQST